MAGENTPDAEDSNLSKTDGLVPKPSAKSFSCPKCGASISVNYPGTTMSIACASCHSLVDVTDENYRKILAECKGGYAPCFPVGTMGVLKGVKWQFIGFLVRMDEASNYTWAEYLLYNPYQGYRWLTENSGHWNFVTMTKRKPKEVYYASDFNFEGEKWKRFYAGNASVIYVSGEFYWLIEVGQKVMMRDFICPPRMLSSEQDDQEVVWSMSEYLPRSEVVSAFKIPGPMIPSQRGIGANQPAPGGQSWPTIRLYFFCFVTILTLAQMARVSTAFNSNVFTNSYAYQPNAKSNETVTTPVFTLPREKANLEIDISADCDNSWFFFDGELVNDKTGVSYPFDATSEYYHGVEDGEGWSEGSPSTARMCSRIPGGDYYINFDTESGDYKDSRPRSFTLNVRRDSITWSNYFWSLVLLFLYPAFAWWSKQQEEVERWSQSDFNPYATGDS